MKKTKAKNSFKEEDRFLFEDSWKCWHCGMNTADCLHHIMGRGDNQTTESSILNAAPMCNQKCHLPYHGFHRNKDNAKKLLRKTIDYLLERGYRMKKIDKDFIAKYQEFYE